MGRILIVSNSPYLFTGLAHIGRYIATALHEAGHQVYYLGFNDPRPTENHKTWAGMTFPWVNYKPLGGAQDQYGEISIGRILAESDPELIITVEDLWRLDHIFATAPCPVVSLIHVESWPMPTEVIGLRNKPNVPNILLKSSMVICTGPFGRGVIHDRLQKLNKQRPLHDFENILKNTSAIIPDAIDTNLFRPLANRKALQKSTFSALKLPEDPFIIGYFGRQNPRKGLPYAIKMMKEWKDRPSNVYLYVHTAINDPIGWNMQQMFDDYEVRDRIIWDKNLLQGQGASPEFLNVLYNSCDMTILPTTAEAAGLTAMEACSAGIPTVVTNCSEIPFYMDGVTEMVRTSGTWIEPGTNFERPLPDMQQLIAKVKKLYRDQGYRKSLGERARVRMVEKFDVAKIKPLWVKVANGMIEAKPKAKAVTRPHNKTICFFGSYFVPDIIGGGELTHYRILKAFKEKGWDVYGFVSRPGLANELIEYDGIKIQRANRPGMEQTIQKFFESIRPDLVITTCIDHDLTRAGFLAAKNVGAKTIYYEQFYNSIIHTGNYPAKNVMELPEEARAPWGKEILSLADVIYSNSSFVQAALKHHQGFDSKILHPMLNPEEYKVPTTGEHVTFINPSAGKGASTVHYMAEKMPDTKFLVVKMNGVSNRDIDQFSGMSNVTLMDFQKDPKVIYALTKILLVPTTIDETFGRIILEAQVSGIPVIGRDVGGVRETIGLGGIVVPKRQDDDAWIEALRTIQGEYESYSQKAKDNVKLFDFQEEMNEFITAMEKRKTEDGHRKTKTMCITPPFAGVKGVFTHLASIVPETGIYECNQASSSRAIAETIIVNNPETVIFGAWIAPYLDAIKLIRQAKPDIKIVVGFFSTFSQTEFSVNNELNILNALVGHTVGAKTESGTAKPLIDEVWMSSEHEVPLIQKGFPNVKVFPCPITLDYPAISKTPSDKIRLSLFCTPSSRKNISAQLVAASLIPNHELHLNGISHRPEYAATLKRLNINFVEHGWMDRAAYLQVLGQIDIGLQVTYTETFNYVIADHFMMGIPVVSSWMNPIMVQDQNLADMIVNNVHDGAAIAEGIKKVYANREILGNIGRTSILLLADKNNTELQHRLGGV